MMRNLYFGCWDRDDLHPESNAEPTPSSALVPSRLKTEESRRAALLSDAVKAAERTRAALITVRQFDGTGNAILAVNHLQGCHGELRMAIQSLVSDLEGAYERLRSVAPGVRGPEPDVTFVDEISAVASERPAEPLSEPIPAPSPLSEPLKPEPSVSSAGGRISSVILVPGVPSPSDVARAKEAAPSRALRARWGA
ncbi:hypothetical protein SPF06_07155 [Sinomonas sp. JGH33]|uniref:Uncharacterized protein n=1 Tax=Sinomonas terricola TaxID=3110330 RepID=A0ABU5T4C3_9MICC|nr:hypothetical protein [Sinomonas sp. JGH33]MEA5454495.1 hypothetical protein [Sinomonas sp. JGH33]